MGPLYIEKGGRGVSLQACVSFQAGPTFFKGREFSSGVTAPLVNSVRYEMGAVRMLGLTDIFYHA